MSIVRVGVVFALCTCAAQTAAQPDEPQRDRAKPAREEYQCLNAAHDDFQKSKLALLNLPGPRTVQSIVSERRFEEEYCLRVARCVVRGDGGKTGEIQASIEFTNCLEEVSLEKYDARKRQ